MEDREILIIKRKEKNYKAIRASTEKELASAQPWRKPKTLGTKHVKEHIKEITLTKQMTQGNR